MKQIEFSRELVVFHPDAKSKDEVLHVMAQRLEELGYVKPSFEQALKDREANYPTGVPLEKNNVAIPHAEGKHVNRSAILACILEDDVFFGSMADKNDMLPVRIVVALVLTDAKKHLSLLQTLMKSVQQTAVTDALLDCGDAQAAYDILSDNIFAAL